MADDFESRFNDRKKRIDSFYVYLDGTYKSLTTVPHDDTYEYRQKEYIISDLQNLQRQIDTFILELRS